MELNGIFNLLKRKWNQMGIKSQNIIQLATYLAFPPGMA